MSQIPFKNDNKKRRSLERELRGLHEKSRLFPDRIIDDIKKVEKEIQPFYVDKYKNHQSDLHTQQLHDNEKPGDRSIFRSPIGTKPL